MEIIPTSEIRLNIYIYILVSNLQALEVNPTSGILLIFKIFLMGLLVSNLFGV